MPGLHLSSGSLLGAEAWEVGPLLCLACISGCCRDNARSHHMILHRGSSLWLPFPLSSFRDGVFSLQDQVIFLFHVVLGRTTPLNGNLCHGNSPQIFVYAQSYFHSFRTSTFIDRSHGVTSLSASGLTMLLARTSGDELRMSQILE